MKIKFAIFFALAFSVNVEAREINRIQSSQIKVVPQNGVEVGEYIYPRGDNELVRMRDLGDTSGLEAKGIETVTVEDYPDLHLYTYVEDEYGNLVTTPRDPADIAADDALIAQLAKDAIEEAEIKATNALQVLVSKSPAEIDAHIDALSDLASVKAYLKRLSKVVLISSRRALRN